MTREQFNKFLKHDGTVLYRGRRYETPNNVPAGEHECIYLWEVGSRGARWFVASKQELLAACYEYLPNVEQLKIEVIPCV